MAQHSPQACQPRRRILRAALCGVAAAAWLLATRSAGVTASGSALQLFTAGGQAGSLRVERPTRLQRRLFAEGADTAVKKEEPLPDADVNNPLLVRPATKARGLGKLMTLCLRERPSVVMKAAGPDSGYRAVQAAAYTPFNMAEEEEGSVVSIKTEKFLDGDRTWMLRTCMLRPREASDDAEVFLMGRDTNVGRLAGAIKARIIEKGRVKIRGFGAKAVSQAEKGVMLATEYFKNDEPETSLIFTPEIGLDETSNITYMQLLVTRE